MLGNDSASGPEVEPAVAQNVEHGEVFGLAQRIFKRQQADRSAQPQGRGLPRQGGQKQLGAGTDAERVEVFLAQPDRVKAELFGTDDEVEGVLIIAALVLAVLEEVEQGKQPEFHTASFSCQMLLLIASCGQTLGRGVCTRTCPKSCRSRPSSCPRRPAWRPGPAWSACLRSAARRNPLRPTAESRAPTG